MKSPGHIAIVGAGMTGLATAWHLQEHGVEVTVLDREGVAAGSSWGNAGWLTPALTLPLSEPSVLKYGMRAMLDPASPLYIPVTADPQLLRFLLGFARNCTPGRWRRAMSVFSEVNSLSLDAFDELGLEEPIHPAAPFLAAFATEEDRGAMVHEFEGAVGAGSSVEYDLLTGEQMRDLEPVLSQGVAHGIALHGQRYIDPPRYMAALGEAVEARGATIRTGVDVVDIRSQGAGVDVVDRDGGTLRADHVVLATGAWMGQLARRVGVRQVVQAGRGYSFTVRPESMPSHPLYFPAQRVACTPLGDRFRVAGMMEFRSADAPLDPRRIRAVIDAVRPMYQGIDWEDRQEEWVGARPCTIDGLPLVGRTRDSRVSVLGGHGMWGVALGPLTGRMLASQLVGGSTPEVMKRFDPLRR